MTNLQQYYIKAINILLILINIYILSNYPRNQLPGTAIPHVRHTTCTFLSHDDDDDGADYDDDDDDDEKVEQENETLKYRESGTKNLSNVYNYPDAVANT